MKYRRTSSIIGLLLVGLLVSSVPAAKIFAQEGPAAEGEEIVRETVPSNGTNSAVPSDLGLNVAGGVTCSGQGPCIVEATGQPLRILPRSLTPLYKNPDEEEAPVSDAVAAFKPAYVFERKELNFSDPLAPTGWYRIGFSQSTPIGWMRAQDVLEWRQALLLAYTHPGIGADKRNPVLMFENQAALESVVLANDRPAEADQLFATILSGEKPGTVIGKETNGFLDIDEDFYMLPVIQWQREEAFDEPSHYLQIFAAVPNVRAAEKGEGTLQDDEVLKEQLSPPTRDIDDLQVDVKFVVDMTGSMQPYIDEVVSAINQVADTLPTIVDGSANVRFGLVGYRDSVAATPELEWTTKNFTPDLLSAQEFKDLLSPGGKFFVADVSSDEWAEDVSSGFKLGVDSNWSSETSVKYLVLIGDASSHAVGADAGASKNGVNMAPEELSTYAIQNGVYTFAVYLKDNVAAADWEKGTRDFGKLAQRPDAQSGFSAVATKDKEQLSDVMTQVSTDIGNVVIAAARDGDVGALEEYIETDAPQNQLEGGEVSSSQGGSAETIKVARGVLKAALVDYLGDELVPPKDFVSWVHDYDLKDPARPTLAVRVWVTKQDLDNIIRQMKVLTDAAQTKVLGRVDFYQALQLVSAKTSLGLEIDPSKTLAQQEFVPKWVTALPYQSRVLGMSPVTFENLTPTEQITFEQTSRSKLQAYEEIFNSPDRWIKVDENDTELQEVTALPLTLLP